MLNIYKASAGSGKTFALTLEYFRIIFENPIEYRNILAVTFTNKATEEMKSRIINELHKLAEGQQSDYGEKLKQELGFTSDQLRDKASLLRTMLLHDYGRIAITTIDRFFQRIIKSFTNELGIFPGYNVELDSTFVLAKAIDKIMQQVKNKPELRAWIGELMSNSVEEGKSWNVKARIAELGEELFKENYMLFDKHILDKFSDKQLLKDYRTFLRDVIRNYESQMKAIGNKAIGFIQEVGLEQADFKGNKVGAIACFYKLASQNYDEPTATMRKGIDNPEAWVTKTSPNRSRIEEVSPQLNTLLKEAVQLYDEEFRNYNSARQLAGNLYQLGIMNDLYSEIRAYCSEKGIMLLSDTTYILNALIDGNDTSFLFEKIGNYYKHLMIDEFQDTSSMQWKNFRPLVVNSLSEGCHAMIVGDVKQSIYRWRNGEWGLLANGVERQFHTLGVDTVILGDNWRSAPEIVNFNNIFFERASRKLTDLYDREAGDGNPWSQAIENAYYELKQNPKKQRHGYVDLKFGPEKREEGSDRMLMEDVVSVIQDIVWRGGSLKDIVILVRNGKEGAFVANYLMEYNKTASLIIHFISNDSLYINSSPYIQFIVAILKYIIEPYNMVNKATIIYIYKAFVKNQENKILHEVFLSVHEDDLFRVLDAQFSMESGHVLSYSLYETIETIIDSFSLKDKREEVPYLIAFQDIIYEYESGNSNSLSLFLEWWEKEQNKKVLTTSESVDAIKILTIHKSKGLEFEYVILPFCSWELDTVRPVRCIWCNNNTHGFNKLEYAPLNYSSKLADTIFREDYYEEHLKAFIDNLNLLYVAQTRAKSELYIRPYQPKSNKDGTIAVVDIGAFIYWVVNAADGEQIPLQWGNKSVINPNPKTGEKSLLLQNYPVFHPEDRITVKYRFRDYTEPEQAGLSAIDDGKLLHEIFKSIKNKDEIEQAIETACLAGLIQAGHKHTYIKMIAEYIDQPDIEPWFASSSKIITERDILFPTGEKVRPDRILLDGDRVTIIDYKFGQNEESKYLKQVKYYCNTLKKMGYPEVEGYIWYVRLGKIVKI